MSDVYVDMSGVERRLDHLSNALAVVQNNVAETNHNVHVVHAEVERVSSDLAELQHMFKEFIQRQERVAALQKAATELIRIRQELESEFGNYNDVRRNMLGILQATDLALVKKTTVSSVSEELMLATPDYWLAPCLIAVSAWINNDRDLANRAISEAMRRDEEKTALTMALICRRNNRTETCYEWLSIYFAKQSALHFTTSNFTYLNAYLNGVFGPDTNHMCDDYVAKWMREIRESGSDYAARQEERWHKYCEENTVGIGEKFPSLSECAVESQDIFAYIDRINSVGNISSNFSQIQKADVDQHKLKADIDQTLVTLISRCDEKEEPLRREERYQLAVRRFDGDTSAARKVIEEEVRRKTEETVDILSQMTNIITREEYTRPSERKAAVSFLKGYIRNGFRSYITEKRPNFPRYITFDMNGWKGSTDCGDPNMLLHSYVNTMEANRRQELDAQQTNTPKIVMFGSLGFLLPALILLLLGRPGWAFISVAIALAGFLFGFSSEKTRQKEIERIQQDYDNKIQTGTAKIQTGVREWYQIQHIVRDFESRRLPDIVA